MDSKNAKDVSGIRTDYVKGALLEAGAPANPHPLFGAWMQAAIKAEVNEPNALALGTVNAEGQPSVRIVLLRGHSEAGFVFYTNYQSQKASDLGACPQAAMTFFWPEMERQVRIEGRIEQVDPGVSDQYFNSRPRGSRIGAWASPQSQVIPGREVLEDNVERLEREFSGQEVPRPPHWGGYLVVPHRIEFWQGRSSRLHDRLSYRKEGEDWILERLAP